MTIIVVFGKIMSNNDNTTDNDLHNNKAFEGAIVFEVFILLHR